MGPEFVVGCIVADDLFVMQISLRDIMDCNDAMMGVVADPFTLAAQVVYKALERMHSLHIDMFIDWSMLVYTCYRCASWQRTCGLERAEI